MVTEFTKGTADLKLKSRMCKVRAKAFVAGELAAEADLLTGIIER